jgi:murein DD-endopeptidase MepM/ murein hydrolase activator NlpD
MRTYWGILLIALAIFSCKDQPADNEQDKAVLEETASAEPNFAYGFDLNEFRVVADTVRSGDIFGELMMENKVSYPKIHQLTERYKDTFDVRRFRVGKPYFILKSKDTSEVAQVFIYQEDPVNYTVVDFRDSVVAYKKKREIELREREVSGVITEGRPLSLVLDEQGVNFQVTMDLSQIYAWTIDFSKLDAGDKFRVIFDEKYIQDSLYAGAAPIKAAYFEHRGKELYAFAYPNDSLGIVEYYDENAENLRRTFLSMPVQFGRLSSKYNLKRRIRYYGYKVRPHKGTDYAAPVGTPILATADGVVTESRRRGGNGKYVKIRHNGTYSTQYLHMKAQKVKQGQYVRQGDVIGWVGMTGNTSGPHVCYRFWKNGRQVDPLKEDLPKAEPLAENLQPEYFRKIESLKVQLDCIVLPEEGPMESEDLITYNEDQHALTEN